MSGRYSLDLIIGDSVIENPLFWTIADIELSFPEGAAKKSSNADRYLAKPEIHVSVADLFDCFSLDS